MSRTIFCVLGGLALGILFAFFNMLISKRSAKSSNVAMVMGGNVVRLILDLVALLIGFGVCKLTGLPGMPTLIAIAVGLSVGGVLFLLGLTKKMKQETQSVQNKDDKETERGE